ncbi:MAG TPA: pentapeptide repeat-containing protein, partial [Ktedonobacterales bacterium]|nr:pentapeptide repeat-containing protein [Ktedonobacterales bacterium]
RGTDLRRASLAGANLQVADLTYALLVSADLTGVTLRGANLSHADLYCALMSAEQHNAAIEAGALVYDPALSELRHTLALR